MQNKRKLLLVHLIGIVVLATAFFFLGALWRVSGNESNKDNRDLAIQTAQGNFTIDTLETAQVFWNEDNITEQFKGRAVSSNVALSLVPTLSTNEQLYDPPQDALYIGRYCATEEEQTTIETSEYSNIIYAGENVVVAWQDDFLLSTFARNGKQITSISFYGMEDSELVSVSYDGMVICPSAPGKRTLYCEIEDNSGIITETGILFDVQEATD